MDVSNVVPEYAPEQIAFIKARRALTMSLCVLFSTLRREGYPESTSDYRILSADGLPLQEHEELEGQMVQVRVMFSHQGTDFCFNAILTNDENWNMTVRLKPGFAPETVMVSGVYSDEIDVTYEAVQEIFWNFALDVRDGKTMDAPMENVGIDDSRPAHQTDINVVEHDTVAL